MSQQSKCTNNSYTSCFELKQYTPLIHHKADFKKQDQKVTISPKELKSKFDKFLLMVLGEQNSQRYLKSHKAFDYNIEIIIDDVGKVDGAKGSYFGKYKALKEQQLIVKIECFIKKLKKAMDEYFPEFIIITNFGTRSGKGFGSFVVNGTNLNEQQILEEYFNIIATVSSPYPLQTIKEIYQIAKSGKNFKGSYLDSELMLYFAEKSIRWEKKHIKKELRSKNSELFKSLLVTSEKGKKLKEGNNNYNENYQFIRVLLGLSDTITFQTIRSKEISEKASNIGKDLRNNSYSKDKKDELWKAKKALQEEAENLKITIKIEDEKKEKDEKKIQRVPSPIIFKVINQKIYILTKKKDIFPSAIFDQTFTLTASLKNGTQVTKLENINTPSKINDADALEMLKHIFDQAIKKYQKEQNEKKNQNNKNRKNKHDNNRRNTSSSNNPFTALKGAKDD